MVNLKKITKIEAATRQLKTAIQLFVSEHDTVSAYTLVRAAEEILDRLCEHKGLERSAIHKGLQDSNINDARKKQIRTKLNEPKNYFKHADRDITTEIEWGDGVIQHYIIDCISMYRRLFTEKVLPSEFMAFYLIHRAKNGDMYDNADIPLLDQGLDDMKEQIRNEGMLAVYNSALAVCEENGHQFLKIR